MLLQPVGQPRLDPPLRIRNDTAFGNLTNEFLVRGTRFNRNVQTGIYLAILAVADRQTVVGVVKRKGLGDRLDGVQQAGLRPIECFLRLPAFADHAFQEEHGQPDHDAEGEPWEVMVGSGERDRPGKWGPEEFGGLPQYD